MAYTTIPKSTDYFNTKLYTGNATGRTISGVGFQPDWSWIKNRSDTSGHRLLDAVRGATKELISNATNAEATEAQSLQSWNSDGFVLGTAAGVNANTNNFVSWNWKANGAGSANTDGSINTTYTSANTTSGMSIIKYTGTGSAGATIGHGLGIKPSMIIIKNLSTTQDWIVYTQSLTATKILYLNQTGAFNDNNVFFNDTEPTTSLITLGSNSSVNGSGNSHVAYCFSDVQGYSKQGSYIGNGSATSPPFIYLGFKPAFVLLKNTTQADSWFLHDSKRDGFNDDNEYLRPNLTAAESSGINRIRLLSNGFSVPTTDKSHNVSGNVYIYMAFAENPFVSSTGIPATAR